MQLKPGRHGSDNDVHSLMSAEVGMGDREPGTAPPQPQHLGPGLHWKEAGPRLQISPG